VSNRILTSPIKEATKPNISIKPENISRDVSSEIQDCESRSSNESNISTTQKSPTSNRSIRNKKQGNSTGKISDSFADWDPYFEAEED
jgi:hypothetical protein